MNQLARDYIAMHVDGIVERWGKKTPEFVSPEELKGLRDEIVALMDTSIVYASSRDRLLMLARKLTD